jgi:hypothetical protein
MLISLIKIECSTHSLIYDSASHTYNISLFPIVTKPIRYKYSVYIHQRLSFGGSRPPCEFSITKDESVYRRVNGLRDSWHSVI